MRRLCSTACGSPSKWLVIIETRLKVRGRCYLTTGFAVVKVGGGDDCYRRVTGSSSFDHLPIGGVGEGFSELFSVPDVVTAAAPFELTVGWMARKRPAPAQLVAAGRASARDRMRQRGGR